MKKISWIFVVLLIIWGCSGGSRGTGGLVIEGSVLTTTGNPVTDAKVTSLNTGDSSTTNQAGNFVIDTDRFSGEPGFIVEADSFEVQSTGGNVPDSARVISVKIIVDVDDEPTATQEVEVKQTSSSSSSSASSSSKSSSSSSSASSSSSSSSNSSSSSSSSNSSSSSSSSVSSSSSSSSDSSISSSSASMEVRVEGRIESLSGATLTVVGKTFTVNGDTDFGEFDSLSDFSVGQDVSVRGVRKNNLLIATRVRLK